MGIVLQFRRRPPVVSQDNPFMVPIAQYFIGLAICGLIAIAIIDQCMGERRR
jgi:hypothetical protein